jgi:8-oxo-dGTP pyrophosphatase MutT (NUDIX family)
MNGRIICEELVVPIVISEVVCETHLGIEIKCNQRYHNVMVKNPDDITYVPSVKKENSYVRLNPILRYYNEKVCWPEHPLNVEGKMQGAIAIVKSSDDKILLVRNRKLWGLPKGARNYKDFTLLKFLTDEHYRKTGKILRHKNASFKNTDSETAIENVCREIMEETGIDVDVSLLTCFCCEKGSNTYCSYDGFEYSYPKTVEEYESELQKNGTDHENDELLWVSKEKLTKMVDEHRGSYNKVFNHITIKFLDAYTKMNIN